jgi:hypothetical protein
LVVFGELVPALRLRWQEIVRSKRQGGKFVLLGVVEVRSNT